MNNAIKNLTIKPEVVLIDAVKINQPNIICESIIKGDALSYSIACASILAKVSRDEKYPNYNFKKPKGYGTKEHIENLKKFGPCVEHRKSFIKNFVKD